MNYFKRSAYADAGAQTFEGTGLTIGLKFQNTAMSNGPCGGVAPVLSDSADVNIPSSWALFDVGGFAVYAEVFACDDSLINATLKTTTPYGVVSELTSAAALASANTIGQPVGVSALSSSVAWPSKPALPVINGQYVFVTFGSESGASIYLNGLLWARMKETKYVPGIFNAPYVRFYFGDLSQDNAQITVDDIQMYNRELSFYEVVTLMHGQSNTC